MRVVPFHLQGKGVLDLDVAADFSGLVPAKWKKKGLFGSTEPTSVLEQRRSPSPQTSTSILSTSLGGSSGSTDTAGVAAVSGNPLHQWPTSQDDSSAGAAAAGTDGGRKEAWAPELQPVPDPLEMSSAGGGGGEKCGGGGGGYGMEEWENMLSESSEVSPGNDRSFFRWFMGDVDDPSLKQLLQTGGGGPSEFEGWVPGYCVAEPGLGFEGGVSAPGNVNLSSIAPPLAASTAATDFALNSSNPLSNLKSPFFGGNNNNTPQNPIFSAATSNALPLSLPLSLPQGAFYQQQQQQFEGIDEKPQLFNLQNQQQANPPPPPHHHQNPAFLLPFSYTQQEQQHLLPPQPKRHHTTVIDPSCQFPKTPFADSGQELLLQRPPPQSFVNEHLIPDHLQKRQAKMKVVGSLENANQRALVDQLYKAAELVESGNFGHAREILARLNHQLSHVGKPLQRAAFYFKEALQLLLKTATTTGCNKTLASSASPLDVVFKINAYKVFSEISPFLQFANFTSNQLLLEALDGFDRIHIIDFDIGIGGQWASFMQELAMRLGGTPTLKITAFASASSHHPLELSLTQENLTHFANGLNISFQFNVINIDAIDTSTIMSLGASAILNLSDNEAIAVNFPVGSSNLPIPLLLRVVKQVSPKIVVSVDHGCVRSDFPFPQHFLHALQSYSVLFDSLDAVNVNSDAVHKIERYLLQPRIESVVLGRHQAGEKMLPWRALFNSAGFSPLPFSNFTETQGEYMVRRLQGRGFHVEKRHASLYLFWQSGELCSVSAWRC
eukprot:TRINITY_DN3671_c0_g3_i2.p1 TRINITY_DN3671_c0_g3~~TRINITY_DN3671_c0_g3_i2.p1  ORF type:complete len:779 (+),score=160.86 TRINITY_DN3671_c0_g3_i2:731-3067(+)